MGFIFLNQILSLFYISLRQVSLTCTSDKFQHAKNNKVGLLLSPSNCQHNLNLVKPQENFHEIFFS